MTTLREHLAVRRINTMRARVVAPCQCLRCQLTRAMSSAVAAATDTDQAAAAAVHLHPLTFGPNPNLGTPAQ